MMSRNYSEQITVMHHLDVDVHTLYKYDVVNCVAAL